MERLKGLEECLLSGILGDVLIVAALANQTQNDPDMALCQNFKCRGIASLGAQNQIGVASI